MAIVEGLRMKESGRQNWREVTDNVFYFTYNLLPAASSRPNWTQEGVDKAISWAAYCENIAARLHCYTVLQEGFTMALKGSGIVSSVQDLKKSRHLLVRSLIQNQLLSPGLKRYIQDWSLTHLGPDVTSSVNQQAEQQEEHAKQLLHSLQTEKCHILQRQLETRINLENASLMGPAVLKETLDNMVVHPRGLCEVLDAVRLDQHMGTSHQIHVVGSQVMQWLEKTLLSPQNESYKSVFRNISSLQQSLLTYFLKKYSNLYRIFLSIMKAEGKKLDPFYDGEGCCWCPRNPATSVLTFQDLVWLSSVLLADSSLAYAFHKQLNMWCTEEGGMVWADVIRHTTS